MEVIKALGHSVMVAQGTLTPYDPVQSRVPQPKEVKMGRCDNCARAKEPDKTRDLFPIKCTFYDCWVDYAYTCRHWVEAESDGFITNVERLKNDRNGQ